MGMLGYYPLVLDGSLASDLEGAQILRFVQITGGGEDPFVYTPFVRLLEPKPSRKGRMKLSFQLVNDPGAIATSFTLGLTIRSPFPTEGGALSGPSQGSPVNQPIISCNGLADVNFILPAAPDTYLVSSVIAAQQMDPAINYSPTFNLKPIPNFSFAITFAQLIPSFLAPIVEFDFGASAAS